MIELSAAAWQALDEVARTVREARVDKARAEASEAAFHAAVYEALENKVPARMLADRLDIPVSRVYAIRNEVARARKPAAAV